MVISLLAMAAPHVFVEAIDQRIQGTQQHVTDWWADDLDGDHTPEAIARICDDSSGYYLVLHGKDLLEAPIEIDGRNSCGEPNRPDWVVHHTGELVDNVAVHHGSTKNVFAIRDNQLVLIRDESHGFDVNRDGSHDDDDEVTDYDHLTFTEKQTGKKTVHAALVLATPNAKRTTTITGKTTVSASWGADDKITLHVHSPKPIAMRVCPETPCTKTPIAAGDHDLDVEGDRFDLVIGGTVFPVHIEHISTEQRFPPPTTPW
ncbi:MAG: hypothetical protein QM831_31770 [Kofleriaceae bacterium]